MTKTIATLATTFSLGAQAAPFLVSDPYQNNAPQPIACRAAFDGSTSVIETPVAKNGDGSVYCSFDLASLSAGGHTAKVWACLDSVNCSDPAPDLKFKLLTVGCSL